MKIFLVILYFLIPCFGEELDKDSRKALEEVQKLLTDPALRQQAIQGDAKAQKADNFAREVVGNNPKALEELFSIVSSVMESMVKKHGGDVPKMNQVMMEFKEKPEKLFFEMTPEQRQRVRELAQKIEVSNTPK